MAFIKKGMATNTGGTVQKLDESQKSKLADAGLTLIPVSNDPSVLQNTQPSIKQVMPGISVAGFDSPNGNFLVLDENNVVHNVISTGPSLDNGGVKSTDNSGTPPTFPFNPDSFVPTSGGGGGTIIPTTPTFPAPLPPNNLGSGRIWTRFETGDIVPNQQETITRALWSGNVGNL